jgi:hypothetical protein
MCTTSSSAATTDGGFNGHIVEVNGLNGADGLKKPPPLACPLTMHITSRCIAQLPLLPL